MAVAAALGHGVDDVDPHRPRHRTGDGRHRHRLQGRLRLLGGVPVLRADQVVRGLLDARGALRDLPQDGAAVADQVVRHLRGRGDPLPRLDAVGDEQVDQQPAIGRRDRAERRPSRATAAAASRRNRRRRRPPGQRRPGQRPPGRPGRVGPGRVGPGRVGGGWPGADRAAAGGGVSGGRVGGEPVDAEVPVDPDRRPRPLAPGGRERVGRVDRRVDAADGPAHLRQRPGQGGGHLRGPPGDQQRHGRVVQEGAARPAAVGRLPPAVQHLASPFGRAGRRPRRTRRLPDDLRLATGSDGHGGRQQHGVLGRPGSQVAARCRREPVMVGGGAPAHGVMLPVVRSCRNQPGSPVP